MTPSAGELAGQDRLVPRRRDEALRGQVVDLVGLDVDERGDERGLVQQVALDQFESSGEVGDPLVVEVLDRRVMPTTR